MEIKNLFTPWAQQFWSQLWGIARKVVKPLQQPIQELWEQFTAKVQPAIQWIQDTVNTGFVEPVMQPIKRNERLWKVNKFLSDNKITVDHIRALSEMDWSNPDEIIKTLRDNGIQIEGMESIEDIQAKQQAQAPQNGNQDWYNNKSYFGDQRKDEWVVEQAWKWTLRTPLTYAQNLIAWPENIAQWSLNLLDKTLWEWALNPLLNVIWGAIKWDKYKDLPTWYNDVPSTNQWTENVASNIIGAGKEALLTDKSYSQANEELKQQQYQAGKDQGIGGSLANIWGGGVSTAFNIMAPWASALFAWASEMPWTQYVTQWLGAITQKPIDYVVNKAGWTQDTAEQIWTMANLALPLARNKIAGLKPTSRPWQILQNTAVSTADAITNPLWTIKDVWVKVFSKTPRPVDEIASNILQPYKGMTENLDDATTGLRRVVEETGTKTSTFDWLLKNIVDTQNKYWKMLSDSLGEVRTATRSPLFDTALTQLAKVYENVESSKNIAVQNRINELGKKNLTTGLTPLEKNEVKILHTKANDLFDEKGGETGWFSKSDLRWLRQDMVWEINSEASKGWVTNISEINKAYWELSDARTLAENQVANLKAYKGRTPPPTTMAKITNMIVDFPIIKQVFSDPTRAVASALFKNLRGDKINPIEVQGRLSSFLGELKKAGAKAEELSKIEKIMVDMKLLPESSSAKIPLTPTEQDISIIKQSNQGISPKNKTNGNLDNSVPIAPNNRTKPVKWVPKKDPLQEKYDAEQKNAKPIWGKASSST